MSAAGDRVVGAAHAANLDRLGWRPFSDGALAAVRGCEGPLYNQYGDGGTLIWFVPEKPVFVDGRQDPYPLPFLLEERRGRGRAQAVPAAVRSVPGSRCAFLPVAASTVDELTAEGWATRFRDDKYAVLAAPSPRK